MRRKGVLTLVTVSTVLCLGCMIPCSAEVNQASEGAPPARLYIRLLGTSQ